MASPCIIQRQPPLDTRILVIPLVGLSLWSPWQLFPLLLASLGPSLAHMHLSCSSPNTAINSCGVTIFRCLVPSVLFVSQTNVFKVSLASVGCAACCLLWLLPRRSLGKLSLCCPCCSGPKRLWVLVTGLSLRTGCVPAPLLHFLQLSLETSKVRRCGGPW